MCQSRRLRRNLVGRGLLATDRRIVMLDEMIEMADLRTLVSLLGTEERAVIDEEAEEELVKATTKTG